jgi:hypothetical protein
VLQTSNGGSRFSQVFRHFDLNDYFRAELIRADEIRGGVEPAHLTCGFRPSIADSRVDQDPLDNQGKRIPGA